MYFVSQPGFDVFTTNFDLVILCFVAATLVSCVPAVTLWNFVTGQNLAILLLRFETNDCCEIPVHCDSLLKVPGKWHFTNAVCISEVSYLVELWSDCQQIGCLFSCFATFLLCILKVISGNTRIMFDMILWSNLVTLSSYHMVWIHVVSFLVS